MPTEDGVDPDHLMLHSLADECQQWGKSHFLKACIFVIAAIVSGIAITRPPAVKLVLNATGSVADISLLRSDANEVIPTAQAADDGSSNAWSAAATSKPARSTLAQDEVDTVAEATGPSPMEHTEDSSEALFGQFQAWAARQHTLAQQPSQPAQSAPAVADALASAEQRPKARSAQRAQPKIIHRRQARMQRDQNERPKTRPTLDAQPQEPVQNAPSFLQSLGLQK
ncbi:MAG TPA: hypothetical protein VE999_03080 [Gemmataceae bacterium]|nr:hypothetical protein [Gemmataceae bacterium]